MTVIHIVLYAPIQRKWGIKLPLEYEMISNFFRVKAGTKALVIFLDDSRQVRPLQFDTPVSHLLYYK